MNSHFKKAYDVGISRHVQQPSIMCSTMTTSRSKLSLPFLSHVIARQRIAQPAAVCHDIRQLHRSSALISQCKSHISKTSQFSPGVSSSWSPKRWHYQEQQRHFTESTKESTDSIPLARGGQSPIPRTDSESSNEKQTTLNFNVNYFLKDIPIGKINASNLEKARAFLFVVSKWHNERGATLSEALLERLYKEQSIGGNSNIVITSEMYNICMDAWNKSNAGGEKIVNHVESIMKRMEERFLRDGQEGQNAHRNMARPDKIGYNCLINAYSKWEEDSSDEVESILGKMKASADAAASSDRVRDRGYEVLIQPDAFTYNSLMNYYATRKDQHLSAQRAEDLLLVMSELSKQDNNIQMDATSFNIVLKAWSNSGGGIHGAHRAESVLQMMMKLYSQGHENVRPDAVSFSTVINAYSKVDPEDASIAVEKVMELLDELEGSYFPDSDTNINSCYNAAANAIVKSCLEDAVDRVRELMTRMKNMDAIPDGNMLASLIEVYAAEGSDESFKRGKELLLEMMDDPEPRFAADSVPFNVLLKSIIKGNNLKRAEELMAMMEKIGGNARPDSWSYNMIISALCRSSAEESEQKAVDYLRAMLKSYRDGYHKAKPDSFVFNCIISMLARSKQEWADNVIHRTLMAMESQQKRGNTAVLPDTITYNLVIGKLAQSGKKEHAKRVMKLLKNMQSNKAIAPDIITYTNVLRLQEGVNPQEAAQIASSYLDQSMSEDQKLQVDRLGFQTLLLALSRSDKFEHAMMARKAWECIEKSDRVKDNILDSGLCNLVLVAYSKASDAKAAGETLSFLSERIGRYKEEKTTVLPTIVGFGAALVSLGKANRIDDALRLLDIMKVLSRDGVPNIEPDVGCYMSILGPLAQYQAENVASQALSVVKRMKDDLETIPTASLNAAIHACSETAGSPLAKRKAVEIALQILQLGRKSESCDAVTYGLMIRTCIKLTDGDDKRLKLVEPLFKLCAKSGLVGKMVMREVKHLKTRLIVNDRLPIEWTINAKDK